MPSPIIYGLHGAAANLFGGTMVGNFLTAVCFGVITVQAWRYFNVFRRDALSTRICILFLCTIECLQLAFVSQSMWHYFIANYGNPLPLANGTWELAIYQVSSATQSATVQTFFAWRVYGLSNSVLFGCIVELFVLVQFGFGMYVSTKANIILSFAGIVEEITWAVNAWLGVQAATDIVICLSMVLLLRQRRTGFKNTDTVLNLMIMWTINTGLVTAVLSIIVLIAFGLYGFHFIVLAIGLPLGGFYTFTMLANLHSRTSLAEKMMASHHSNAASRNGPGGDGQSWPMTVLSQTSRNQLSSSHAYQTESNGGSSGDRRQGPIPVIIGILKEEEITDEDGLTYTRSSPLGAAKPPKFSSSTTSLMLQSKRFLQGDQKTQNLSPN